MKPDTLAEVSVVGVFPRCGRTSIRGGLRKQKSILTRDGLPRAGVITWFSADAGGKSLVAGMTLDARHRQSMHLFKTLWTRPPIFARSVFLCRGMDYVLSVTGFGWPVRSLFPAR